MLAISDLTFFLGGQPLFEDANLHIKNQDKIGLIGKNGTGKTTLLRLINEEYTPDKGTISKSKECTIGFLNQDLLSMRSENSILSVAMEAFERENAIQTQIDDILKKMETDYSDALANKLASLQHEFETLDGYSIQAQAEEVLEGLGFQTSDLSKPLNIFSGGWRMRVMLAKILLYKPSLLLLDEPTNHLDLPSIQWIESYLSNYDGGVIVVSHDQQFLDNVTNVTVEVSNKQLHSYPGNYSFYLEEKEERKRLQKAAYENQQDKIKQTEKFIERFRAKANKAKQVQSKIKQLEKMEKVDDVDDDNIKINFRFNFGQHSGKRVLELNHISKSYPGKELLKNTNGVIERGDKIALIGANGKGKSTLLRIINGNESFEGERKEGYRVIPAFYAQHQLESLTLSNDLLQELKATGIDKTETEFRSILGCFLFTDDDVFKKIKVLSGGEKSRVALAKTLISEANFLILDEPTNHLDITSVNILIQALQQYEGTVVIVSHNRYFINEIANKIWYIEDKEIKEYPGSYDEFEYWRQEKLEKEKQEAAKPDNKSGKDKKNNQSTNEIKPQSKEKGSNNKIDKETKKNINKVKNKLQQVENEITELEKSKENIEKELADPKLHENPDLITEKNQSYKEINQSLEEKNNLWERYMEEMESLEQHV